MNKRWRKTTQEIYPLSCVNKRRLISALDCAVFAVNPSMAQVKSPAEEFDESHRVWVENGRGE